MDKRIITVKGKGNISQQPDLVVLTLNLKSKNYKYEEAMNIASASIKSLVDRVVSLGFDRKDLKTKSFNIDANYERYHDQNDNYHSRFTGYTVSQTLSLAFDFDSNKLGTVLQGITEMSAKPELSIGFTVKDQELLEERLLEEAAKNAQRKAKVLAKASGSMLGKLISIDYDWDELHLYSDLHVRSDMLLSASSMPEIEPENIQVSDTVRFRWEIV